MQQTQVSDLAIGASFRGFLLIKQATIGIAKNEQRYLSLLLEDKSATISTKVWSVTDEDIDAYTAGVIVHISATVNEYRGVKQFQSYSLRIAQPSDNICDDDLRKTAPESETVLYEAVETGIASISNAHLRNITRAFSNRYHKEFYEYPAAAVVHHDYVRGLAYHTVSMLRIGQALCTIYPSLNRDLLTAGIILHDIGKIHEYTSPTDMTLTLDGKMLGHIPIMTTEIHEMAHTLGIPTKSEEVILLQHMILAHHGRPEWGSARTPLLREAQLLHHIDKLDADINILDKALGQTMPGSFTETIRAMDNRSFYNPRL